MEECLACSLTGGRVDLLGGRIFATEHWVVEHCIGSLGVGTLIVKPFRHCLHVWELKDEETAELGPLLKQVARAIESILNPDQVYVCLWSHAGWEPGHIHFVLQPSWNSLQEKYEQPGPFMQTEMFLENRPIDRKEVEEISEMARSILKETWALQEDGNLGC